MSAVKADVQSTVNQTKVPPFREKSFETAYRFGRSLFLCFFSLLFLRDETRSSSRDLARNGLPVRRIRRRKSVSHSAETSTKASTRFVLCIPSICFRLGKNRREAYVNRRKEASVANMYILLRGKRN